MTVRQILERKGREVTTMSPSATLADAVQILAERGIGAVILLGGPGTVAGIISERDIVRLIATRGPACLGETLSQVMTSDVTTCSEETTLDEAMGLMTNGRFRHIPVCRERELVGIVSIGDVVKQRIEAVEREADEMRHYIAG